MDYCHDHTGVLFTLVIVVYHTIGLPMAARGTHQGSKPRLYIMNYPTRPVLNMYQTTPSPRNFSTRLTS